MGGRPNICICAMNESMVFRHYCVVTLIVLMETSARSMQRLLCTVARPFLHLSPLHDGVVEGQRFAEPGTSHNPSIPTVLSECVLGRPHRHSGLLSNCTVQDPLCTCHFVQLCPKIPFAGEGRTFAIPQRQRQHQIQFDVPLVVPPLQTTLVQMR